MTPPGPVPDGGHGSLLCGDGTEVHHLQVRKGGDHIVSNNAGMNKQYTSEKPNIAFRDMWLCPKCSSGNRPLIFTCSHAQS